LTKSRWQTTLLKAVIVCSKCGFRNDDGVEFCANPRPCGAFLPYEGTKTEGLSGGITLAVAPAVVSVKPGEEATAEVRVRNKSNVVDQYDIQVVGEPSRWTLTEPTTLSLFPDAEGVARIRFRPVRSPEVPAGRKPFSVAVQSKASAGISAYQDGTIDVAPFKAATLAIAPRTARGGESASYRVTIENQGNAPLQATLEGDDADEVLTFRFDPPALTVAPGQLAYIQLLVQPRATFYDAPPQPHAFKVQLGAEGLPPVTADATMLQEAVPRPVRKKFPLIPLLLGVLLIGVLAGATLERDPLMRLVGLKAAVGPSSSPGLSAGATRSPAPTPSASPSPSPASTVALVQIPNVTCMTAAVAQQAIQGAGFRFAGSFVANPFYPRDTVFKTQPLALREAPQGSEVTAFVSTGPPPGIVGKNSCLNIIRLLPPGFFQLATPSPTP
jgi:hypothetical protein